MFVCLVSWCKFHRHAAISDANANQTIEHESNLLHRSTTFPCLFYLWHFSTTLLDKKFDDCNEIDLGQGYFEKNYINLALASRIK